MLDDDFGVVLARVYQGNDLIGVIPRTSKHGETLDALFYLGDTVSLGSKAFDQPSKINAQLIRDYLHVHESHPTEAIDFLKDTKGDLVLKPVASRMADVFLRMEKGGFPEEVIQEGQNLLEAGSIRTAEKITNLRTGNAIWQTQMYVVDAMNALFKRDNVVIGGIYYDKVPLLTETWGPKQFKERGVRFIPGSFARAGSWIGYGVTLMPGSIVNSGANVGDYSTIGENKSQNIMVDGGARVATGAQIGRNVKMGAGSGVEGILEPKGTLPTIVEDNVRIGANCELAGIIEEGALIASGVVMSKQKKIFDLRTGKEHEPRYLSIGGKMVPFPYIPKNRIAVPGTYRHKTFDNFGVACTLLLEKDASESDFMELPKNPDLYMIR